MTGKTHRMIGMGVGLGTATIAMNGSYSPATFAFVLLAAYFGSLIPDLDESTAEFWDGLPFGHIAGAVVDPFIKHRNFSHSILGIIIFCGLIWLLLRMMPSYWGVNTYLVELSFSLAFASHLLADMITVEGVPLFYPWKRFFGIPPKPLDGIRIVTGKWFENLVIFPLMNIVLVILVISNWSKIKAILLK